MPSCYTIDSWSVTDLESGLGLFVQTVTRQVASTDFDRIIGLTSGTIDDSIDAFLSGADFVVLDGSREELEALLRAHAKPTITAETDCDVAVCLDLYLRSIKGSGPSDWPRTRMGGLIYQAKYQGGGAAALAPLCDEAVAFVRSHPIFSRATHVVPMPSSTVLGAAPSESIPATISRALLQHLDIEPAGLQRIAVPAFPQKNLPDGVDPDENQRGTMAATITNGATAIIVDDTLQSGGTLTEGARALREAGARRILSLSMAKDIRGTKKFWFDDYDYVAR